MAASDAFSCYLTCIVDGDVFMTILEFCASEIFNKCYTMMLLFVADCVHVWNTAPSGGEEMRLTRPAGIESVTCP